MLRPTESPTLFLQQLGRGLRKSRRQVAVHGAGFCWSAPQGIPLRPPLPCVARWHPNRGRSSRSRKGFPFLPAGCSLELDPVHRRSCCGSIRNAIPSRVARQVRRAPLAWVTSRWRPTSHETGLELEDVYASGHTWTEMRRAAGCRRLERVPTRPRCSGQSAG